MFEVASGTAGQITANLSSQLADPGTLVIVALVAGIPLAFYVLRRVIALVPKGR